MRYLHTMVRITDVDASLHFYCDLLGLEMVKAVESEKGRYTNYFPVSYTHLTLPTIYSV